MKNATFAAQRNGHADKSGYPRAVDLRHTVKVDDYFARASLKHRSERSGQLVAGIADGEASVNIKNPDACLFAYIDFNGSVLGHIFYVGVVKQTLKLWKGLPQDGIIR